jgi:hypothetical protein
MNESQGILGLNGPGPFKIANNHIEGGSQGIMFGGGDPNVPGLIPSDIEIRRNHVIRPLSWRGPWQAKNLLELKVGQRVLIEANVFENNWSEGQAFPFIWWSVNQDGRCTWCTTTDVTFRYNRVRNVANGFNLAATGGRPVPPLRRVTIAHNVLTGENNGPLGRAYQIEGPLVGLTIANNTQIGGYNVIVASGIEGQTMPDFVFRNNVTGADTYPFASPQANGPALFTYLRVPAANVAGNVISADQAGPGGVPPGNAYAASSAAIGFVNLAGGDLRLAPTSPFRDRGVGDSRPGAEIEAIDAMTQGVVR